MLPSRAVKERLPIAISIAALVVAVLGATGLGEAAQNGVTAGATKAKRATGLGAEKSSARRGPRGPRGYRGYRGYRGLRGFQGPPGDKGDKGDKGDTGPSDGFFASSETPVNISGQSPASATVVLRLPTSGHVSAHGKGQGRGHRRYHGQLPYLGCGEQRGWIAPRIGRRVIAGRNDLDVGLGERGTPEHASSLLEDWAGASSSDGRSPHWHQGRKLTRRVRS